MKKLMIAAAIVCAAAMSQAATVSWSSGVMYAPAADGDPVATGTTKISGSGYSAYAFDLVSEAVFNDLTDAAAIWEAVGKGSTLTRGDWETSTLTTANSEGPIQAWSAATAITGGNFAFDDVEDMYDQGDTFYGAVVVTYDKDGDGVADFYTASKFSGDVAQKGIAFGGAALDGGNAVWTATAVPEPTSGLLLLLGVAGLALRRRRA